jgi:hypothetical protein
VLRTQARFLSLSPDTGQPHRTTGDHRQGQRGADDLAAALTMRAVYDHLSCRHLQAPSSKE